MEPMPMCLIGVTVAFVGNFIGMGLGYSWPGAAVSIAGAIVSGVALWRAVRRYR